MSRLGSLLTPKRYGDACCATEAVNRTYGTISRDVKLRFSPDQKQDLLKPATFSATCSATVLAHYARAYFSENLLADFSGHLFAGDFVNPGGAPRSMRTPRYSSAIATGYTFPAIGNRHASATTPRRTVEIHPFAAKMARNHSNGHEAFVRQTKTLSCTDDGWMAELFAGLFCSSGHRSPRQKFYGMREQARKSMRRSSYGHSKGPADIFFAVSKGAL